MASQSPSEFSRRNRAILAERLRWPDGALQACADLEDAHPGWHVSWLAENITPGFERPAGFHASYSHERHRGEAFAATAGELESLLIEVPEHDYSVNGCDWCLARL
jgi:hypothetical protein